MLKALATNQGVSSSAAARSCPTSDSVRACMFIGRPHLVSHVRCATCCASARCARCVMSCITVYMCIHMLYMLYVHVCVYIYIYIYIIHIYMYIYIYVIIYIHIYIYIYIYSPLSLYLSLSLYIYIYVYMSARMHEGWMGGRTDGRIGRAWMQYI